MNRDAFIKITFASHKLVSFLPQEEVLRDNLIEKANNILAWLLVVIEQESRLSREEKKGFVQKAIDEIDSLKSMLREVQGKQWIEEKNFLMLQEQYSKMRTLLEGFLAELKQESALLPLQKQISPQELPSRQQKIMELLRHKKMAQVWELQKVFPNVTKRTLRRDLDNLLKQNLIERVGEWNAIAYRLAASQNSE